MKKKLLKKLQFMEVTKYGIFLTFFGYKSFYFGASNKNKKNCLCCKHGNANIENMNEEI